MTVIFKNKNRVTINKVESSFRDAATKTIMTGSVESSQVKLGWRGQHLTSTS